MSRIKELLEKAAEKEKKNVKKTTMFGQTVYLRQLDAGQRDQIESDRVNTDIRLTGGQVSGTAKLNLLNTRAKFVCMVLADEEGNQLYNGPQDIHTISKWPQKEVDRIYDEGMEFNGMDKEALEKAAKNLQANQTENISTT